MIAPEIYYERNLKNKSYTHIEKDVKRLEEDIDYLENRIKNDQGTDFLFIDNPDLEHMLKMTREYLVVAKKALEDFNEEEYNEYLEEKIKSFNEKIPYIETIEFIEGGFLTGNDIREVEILDNEILMNIDRSYNEYKGLSKLTKKDFPYDKETFLEKLESLNLGAWENDYINDDILDGTQWDLKISYSDDTAPFLSGGSNEFPDNYEDFAHLMAMDYDFK